MVFAIAEIGVNWDGEFELAKEMMLNAKAAGFDAVKFQAYEKENVKNHPEASRLVKTTITKDNVEIINNLAKDVGIEWFCTPMYPEAVDMLNPFVNRFKIRAADSKSLLQNKTSGLIERVLNTNKEVIISTEFSPRNSMYFADPKIKWLYCVSKYPCSFTDLDFSNMKDFDGYSNHCPHILAPLTAVILGAEIIEIHITPDKTKQFVDNAVSLDYTELNELMNLIHLSDKIKK